MNARPQIPPELERFLTEHGIADPTSFIALYSLVCAAHDGGEAVFNDIAVHYRTDYLKLLRAEGRDAEREAGRLSLDEVRDHLARVVFPRFVAEGIVVIPDTGLTSPDAVVRARSSSARASPASSAAPRRSPGLAWNRSPVPVARTSRRSASSRPIAGAAS